LDEGYKLIWARNLSIIQSKHPDHEVVLVYDPPIPETATTPQVAAPPVTIVPYGQLKPGKIVYINHSGVVIKVQDS
jgi:hypothetical protein